LRVLGVDTSLRSTGFAVVDSRGSRLSAVEFGIIRNTPSVSHSECLRRIGEGITDVLSRTRPEAAAIEGGFYCKNARTALVLGEARGVVIAACASAGVPVFEYSPRHVKQALTGFGGAAKEQVGKMICSILGLPKMPRDDESDALAIGLCHIQNQSGIAELRPKPI